MRIAILMGITYDNNPNLNTLPACKNDLDIVEKIIDATKLYDEKIVLNDDYPTAYSAIEKITNFVDGIEKKSATIDEVFVYYSGHGGFSENEFYYAWNDYTSNNPNTTSLINSQFDDLLRRLKAKLTVKFIDACQSGLPYIKDIAKPTFQDCFFCFSCRKNQSSSCNDKNSYFTQALVESIEKCLANKQIRYRDIQNYIADKFTTETEDENGQKPYFCSQGKNTDVFCEVSDELKNVVEDFFNPIVPETNHDEPIEVKASETDYLEIIAKIDSSYLDKKGVSDLSNNVFQEVSSIDLIDELKAIQFKAQMTVDKINRHLPCYNSLCSFVDGNCADYFVEMTYDREMRTVKRKKKNFGFDFSSLLRLYGDDESSYEWVKEPVSVPTSFYIRNDLSYDYISFKILSGCKSITNKELILIPFYNNTTVYLVFAQIDYKYIGIEEIGPNSASWKGTKCSPTDLVNVVKQMINDFQYNTYKNIKEFLDRASCHTEPPKNA